MLRFSLAVLVSVAVAVSLAGCSGPADSGPARVAVSGTVTYNGSPVEGASVTFSPQDKGGLAAAGTTDAQGHFKLTTINADDGAVPGSYAVMISKTEGEAASGETQTEEEAYKQAFPGNQPAAESKAKDLLPAKYKDKATSGLTATVAESGKNDFTFELKDE